MWYTLARQKDPWRQGLANIGNLGQPSSTTSEVSKPIHVDHPKHSVEMDNTEVLTTEPRWFERGVKEAIYIRALNPSLNRGGGRHNLPPVWDNIIKKRLKADRPRRMGGWGWGSSPSRTASQTTSLGRLNWWSWHVGERFVSWFYIILSIKCTKNCVMWNVVFSFYMLDL